MELSRTGNALPETGDEAFDEYLSYNELDYYISS